MWNMDRLYDSNKIKYESDKIKYDNSNSNEIKTTGSDTMADYLWKKKEM